MLARIALMGAVLFGSCASTQLQPSKDPQPSRQENNRTDTNRQQAAPPVHVTVTTPEKSPQEKEEERNRATRQDTQNSRIAESTDRMAWFTLGLLVVSAFQLVSSILGFSASKLAAKAALKSANVTEQAMIPSQRAYLTFSSCVVGHYVPPLAHEPQGFVLSPQINNTGQTPARAIFAGTEKIVFEKGQPHRASSKPTTTGNTAMSVGGRSGFFSKEVLVTNQEIEQLLAKTHSMAIHVYCEYRDVFTNTPVHHFSGCMFVRLKDDPRRVGPKYPNAFLFDAGATEHQHED